MALLSHYFMVVLLCELQKVSNSREQEVRDVIQKVYEALKIKGYDPISQIVGYILSGDPTYITSYNGARGLIAKIERDELLEEVVKNYIKTL